MLFHRNCASFKYFFSSPWATSIFHFKLVLPFPIKIYPLEIFTRATRGSSLVLNICTYMWILATLLAAPACQALQAFRGWPPALIWWPLGRPRVCSNQWADITQHWRSETEKNWDCWSSSKYKFFSWQNLFLRLRFPSQSSTTLQSMANAKISSHGSGHLIGVTPRGWVFSLSYSLFLGWCYKKSLFYTICGGLGISILIFTWEWHQVM